MIRHVPRELADAPPARPFFPPATQAPPVSAPAAGERARAQLTELLSDELSLAPERIGRLCERELARFRGAREVYLHLHPEDVALVPSCAELAQRFELKALVLCEDRALRRGGCLIDSERGRVDARIETRIARMLALLYRQAP